MIRIITILTVILLVPLGGTARARHHRATSYTQAHIAARTAAPDCQFLQPCGQSTGFPRFLPSGADFGLAGGLVGHPKSCPLRNFCGCGASVRAFGHSIRSLWLAAAWGRFPPTSPHPGAAAYRPHHVFILEHHIGGQMWMVYDANSGGHRTRRHPRSIAGFRIVDPHA